MSAASRRTAELFALAIDAAPIFGIALVTFVLFKVLSLFVAPANVILCLLAIGHPAGVLVGARFYEERFERALRAFFVLVCGSVLALTLIRRLTPALAPPWISGGYPLGGVLQLLAVCAAAFMPLFVGSGVVEYLVLQRCRERTGSTGRAYGVLLGGTLAGLVIGFALLPWAGALGVLALAVAVLAAAASSGGRAAIVAAGVIACAASAAFPRADAAFIVAISPGGKYTSRGAIDDGAALVDASWDRQSYTQVLATEGETFGAYDNLVYWDVKKRIEVNPQSKDDLVFRVLAPKSRVAIIGVGGGRQLHQALAIDRGLSVDGFEINEAIVRHYLATPADNGGAFVAPGVRVFARDGRRGVLEHEPYDCIYLPEAGTVLGYYRTLAIDLNFLHTAEAYRGYASRLREGGLLASAFASYADPGNYVTRRVAASFREMGLSVRAFANRDWAVVLGTRPGEGEAMLRRAEEIARERGIPPLSEDADSSWPPRDDSTSATPHDTAGASARTPHNDAGANTAVPGDSAGSGTATPHNGVGANTAVPGDSAGSGTPPHNAAGATLPGDDVGLNLILALSSRDRLLRAFAAAASIVLVLCAAAWIALSRSARRKTGQGEAAPLALAMGLGASFLLVENAVILNLARRLWNMADAVILGSAAFLVCAVLGAALAHALKPARFAVTLRLGLLAVGAALVAFPAPESALVLAGALVLAVSSGSFFPLLLDARSPALTPYVYAGDGLGALFGTQLVFFVPLLSGIATLSVVAAAACATVGAGVVWISRSAAHPQSR